MLPRDEPHLRVGRGGFLDAASPPKTNDASDIANLAALSALTQRSGGGARGAPFEIAAGGNGRRFAKAGFSASSVCPNGAGGVSVPRRGGQTDLTSGQGCGLLATLGPVLLALDMHDVTIFSGCSVSWSTQGRSSGRRLFSCSGTPEAMAKKRAPKAGARRRNPAEELPSDMYDEVDAFHKQRDRVALDKEVGRQPRSRGAAARRPGGQKRSILLHQFWKHMPHCSGTSAMRCRDAAGLLTAGGPPYCRRTRRTRTTRTRRCRYWA